MNGLNLNLNTIDLRLLPLSERIRFLVYKLKSSEKDITTHFNDYFDTWQLIISNINLERPKLLVILKDYFLDTLLEHFNPQITTTEIYLPVINLFKEKFPEDYYIGLLSMLCTPSKNKKISNSSSNSNLSNPSLLVCIVLCLVINKNNSQSTSTNQLIKALTKYSSIEQLTSSQKTDLYNEFISVIFHGRCKNIYLINYFFRNNNGLKLNEVLSAIASFLQLPSLLSSSSPYSSITLLNKLFASSLLSREYKDLIINETASYIYMTNIMKSKSSLDQLLLILKEISASLLIEISKRHDISMIIKTAFNNDTITPSSIKQQITIQIIDALNLIDKNLGDGVKYSKWFAKLSGKENTKINIKNEVEQLTLF
ncbi:MAG: hypothetical protein HQK49_21325 [Oligoflexia bacterium]|nr:hypothetical protein [Oligoflexia bacterium]